MIESNNFRITLLSIWWGVFTFYSGVVVPLGMEVLGSHTQMGLITQKVTIYLNYISLIIFLLLAFSLRKESSKTDGLIYQIIAISMISMQALLFMIHYFLSDLIDFKQQKIISKIDFYLLHRIYLIIETIIWMMVSGLIFKMNREVEKPTRSFSK